MAGCWAFAAVECGPPHPPAPTRVAQAKPNQTHPILRPTPDKTFAPTCTSHPHFTRIWTIDWTPSTPSPARCTYPLVCLAWPGPRPPILLPTRPTHLDSTVGLRYITTHTHLLEALRASAARRLAALPHVGAPLGVRRQHPPPPTPPSALLAVPARCPLLAAPPSPNATATLLLLPHQSAPSYPARPRVQPTPPPPAPCLSPCSRRVVPTATQPL